jgi:hypothetical protein
MYSILSQNPDTPIIGVANGGSQAEIIKDGFSGNNYNVLMNHWGSRDSWKNKNISLPDGVFIEYLKLRNRAKLTDLMSYRPALIPSEMLISQKVKDLLKDFNIHGASFVKANVNTKDGVYPYYLLVLPSIPNEWISYSKSSLKDDFDNEEIALDSYEDYVSKTSENPCLDFKTITLKKEFDSNLDLFMGPGWNRFVSEKLRTVLEDSDVIALNITPFTGKNRCPEIVIEK